MAIFLTILTVFNLLTILYYLLGMVELLSYKPSKDGKFFTFLYKTLLSNKAVNKAFIITTIIILIARQFV